MAELSMGGCALYLIVALGLPMLIQRRRTGASGFQAISGKAGSLEWFAGILPAIAILGSAVSPALIFSGVVQPLSTMDSPAAVTFAAQLAMGRSWRIGVKQEDRTELVTVGLFSWVRNPIFAAMLVAFLGLLLMAPTALAAGSWILLLLALELQVRLVEEPYLLRVHGDKYAQYAKSVGRFFPRLGFL